MNPFEKIVNAVAGLTMAKPPFYGWYHTFWISVTIAACILIFNLRKQITERAVNVTLIAWASVLIFLEICKQIVVSFHYDGETVIWSYNWASFPFQFCSCPLFVALPAGILKKGKIKRLLISFIGAFAIIGGGFAMLVPANMFSNSVFLNVHTMVWHSSMVCVCFLLLATRTVTPSWRSLLDGLVVFINLVFIALLLNVLIGGHMGIKGFNLFYISPYEAFDVPLIQFAYAHLPYPVYLLLYISLFTLAATLVLLIAHGGHKLVQRSRKKPS